MIKEIIYITKTDRYIVKEQNVVIINDNYILVTDDHIPSHVYLYLTFDRNLETNKKGRWCDNKTTTGNICMASYSLLEGSRQLNITINPLYKEISKVVKHHYSKVREVNPHIKLFNQRLSLLSSSSKSLNSSEI